LSGVDAGSRLADDRVRARNIGGRRTAIGFRGPEILFGHQLLGKEIAVAR
jgi:hypothetical protein